MWLTEPGGYRREQHQPTGRSIFDPADRKDDTVKLIRFAVCAAALVALLCPAVNLRAQQNTIEIHAKRFEFVPAEITLKKGQTATLSLVSDDVPHSLLVEGLKINAPIVKDHPTQIQVTPQQTGDFKGRCGKFCGMGHGKMTFTVHVTE